MNELIKITQTEVGQVVSARELHSFLGAGSDVPTWFKNQVEKCMLIEGEDFTQLYGKSTGGRKSIDYAVKISAAKEISMMNGGEKGKQARLYFIECEKQAAAPKLLSAKELAQLVIRAEEEKELLQATIAKQAPAVKYVNQVLQAENTHTVTTIAKEVGMSAEALNKLLQEKKIQYKHAGHWVLYAPYQDKGYTKTKTTTYTNSEDKPMTSIQTVWTERGRVFIHHLLEQRKQA